MRIVILTADDFGLSPSINEAVAMAYGEGLLTSASLMVTAPYREDAVAKAKRLPGLGVGLHLVLADGLPALPAAKIGLLLNSQGRFDRRMLGASLRFFFSRSARKQLEAEIHAQFQAYVATGLELDHVDVHKHFHLHPTISAIMIRVGLQYGMSSVRVPKEPPVGNTGRSGRSQRAARAGYAALLPWVRILQARLDASGIHHNDHIFGLADSGAMSEARILEILDRLSDGVTEIYFHPALNSQAGLSAQPAEYRHAEEYLTLTSTRVRHKLEDLGILRRTYGELIQRNWGAMTGA